MEPLAAVADMTLARVWLSKDPIAERTRRGGNVEVAPIIHTSMKTVFCIAVSHHQADRIVDQLRLAGYSSKSISVLFPHLGTIHDFAYAKKTVHSNSPLDRGEVAPTSGGALGWIAGIGTLVLPDAGPFIAAGPIIAAINGAADRAAIGGIAGGLIELGAPEFDARSYEEKVTTGDILIAVHGDQSEEIQRAKDLFARARAHDICVSSEPFLLSQFRSKRYAAPPARASYALSHP